MNTRNDTIWAIVGILAIIVMFALLMGWINL